MLNGEKPIPLELCMRIALTHSRDLTPSGKLWKGMGLRFKLRMSSKRRAKYGK